MTKISGNVRAFAMSALAITCLLGPALGYANEWVDSGLRREQVGNSWMSHDIVHGKYDSVTDAPLGMFTHCLDYSYPYAPKSAYLWCYDDETPDPTSSNRYIIFRSISAKPDDTNVYLYGKDPGEADLAITSERGYSDLSTIPHPKGGTWNDRIESVRLPRGLTVRLCDDKNLGGYCENLTTNPCKGMVSLGAANTCDYAQFENKPVPDRLIGKVSSVQVYITRRQK